MPYYSRRPAPYRLVPNMRVTLLGVGMLSLGLLAGCQEQDADTFIDADRVTLGEDIQGELTSTSPINFNDGTRHGRHWVCQETDSGRLYRLQAPFDASISLFSENANWLGKASHTSDLGAQVLVDTTPGCSLLVVNSVSQDAFGPYELIADTPGSDSDLTEGTSITGAIGNEADRYPFTIDSPRQVSLRLLGAGDAGLSLQGGDEEARAKRCSDDGQTLETYLPAGDYAAVITPGQAGGARSDAACAGNFVSNGGGYRLSMEHVDLSSGVRNSGPLRDGDDINGDLDASSRVNEYSLSLDTPSRIKVIMNSSEFDTMLGLSGPNTSIQVDDTGMGSNAELSTVLMPGEYTVEASGYEGQTGHYRLLTQLSAFEGDIHEDSGPLISGETVTGLAMNIGRTNYILSLDQPSEVEILASSSNFDTRLLLRGDGTAIDDDDGGNNTNSRIATLLGPGEYNIQVSSYHGTTQGTFQLVANVSPFEGEMQNDGALEPGNTIQGVLNEASNHYTLTLEEPSAVSMAMNSSSFDAILQLQGEGVDMANDDGGIRTNALIETVLDAGEYAVTAASYDGSGRYSLELDATAFNGALQSGGEVRPGETVHGMLDSNETLSYQLIIEEEGPVRIETSSSAVDTVLSLVGNNLSLSNDDGGSTHLGSLIETTLSPGRYDLSIAGYGAAGWVRVDVTH